MENEIFNQTSSKFNLMNGVNISLDNYDDLRYYTGTEDIIQLTDDYVAGIFKLDLLDTISLDNDGTIITDGQGRRWKRHYTENIDAQWFGVIPNTGTDITPKINNLTNFLRTFRGDSTNEFLTLPVAVNISHGRYKISSWNLTNFVSRQLVIECAGAVFEALTADKAVVDMLGSRWIKLNNLIIISHQTVNARCGLQLGNPLINGTNGNNTLRDIMCIGHFSQSALYNSGCETTHYYDCTFENRSLSANTYAAMFDGALIKAPLQSDYVVSDRPQNKHITFTHNSFYGCQFRHAGLGSGVYMSATHMFKFDQSNYVLSLNEAGFEIFVGTATINSIRGCEISVQYETYGINEDLGTTGLKHAVRFVGDYAATLYNFTLKTSFVICTQAVFHYEGVNNKITLANSDINISHIYRAQQGAVMFSHNGGKFDFSGNISILNGEGVNLGVLNDFSGTFFSDTPLSSLLSIPVSGNYRLMDAVGNIQENTASLLIEGTNSTIRPVNRLSMQSNFVSLKSILEAGGVILGNSNVAGNVVFIGSNPTSHAPRLLAQGEEANIDLDLRAKGTGRVHIGTYNADAGGGYITVKDYAGVERKLKVIP